MKINKKPLIIHCGHLNSGQDKLKNKYEWKIIPIKAIATCELSSYYVVIIDEAQRIYPDQLKRIVEIVQSTNGSCIFSYDKLQTLSNQEEIINIDQRINNINPINYKLSEKIRTNKEIASFIKALFNNKRNDPLSNKENIELYYFKDIDDAKEFLGSLNTNEWEILRFTPSQYKNEHHEKYSEISSKISHRVIGQEFDNVAITIDQFFSYNKKGELIYRGYSYYHPVKMLLQNITRTRKRLCVVIIDNNEILDRCISVLQGKIFKNI